MHVERNINNGVDEVACEMRWDVCMLKEIEVVGLCMLREIKVVGLMRWHVWMSTEIEVVEINYLGI